MWSLEAGSGAGMRRRRWKRVETEGGAGESLAHTAKGWEGLGRDPPVAGGGQRYRTSGMSKY